MFSEAARLLPAKLKDKGWSQNELERRMNVTAGNASRWCSGARSPNRDHANWMQIELGLDASLWSVPANDTTQQTGEANG